MRHQGIDNQRVEPDRRWMYPQKTQAVTFRNTPVTMVSRKGR